LTRAWRLVLPAVLGGLLAGVWLGARCERAAARRLRREGPSPERMLRVFRRELRLREDQVGSVRAVLEARRPAFLAARREEEAHRAALRADLDQALAPLLDETQKKRHEELRARWEKRLKESSPPLAP
jgi:hypothetical protein